MRKIIKIAVQSGLPSIVSKNESDNFYWLLVLSIKMSDIYIRNNMKSNIQSSCVYINLYKHLTYTYLHIYSKFSLINYIFVFFCFQERNHTSVNGWIVDFAFRAPTNLHVTNGNTRAKNRSNATSANGTLRDLTIWHCIWNAMNRGVTVNLS